MKHCPGLWIPLIPRDCCDRERHDHESRNTSGVKLREIGFQFQMRCGCDKSVTDAGLTHTNWKSEHTIDSACTQETGTRSESGGPPPAGTGGIHKPQLITTESSRTWYGVRAPATILAPTIHESSCLGTTDTSTDKL